MRAAQLNGDGSVTVLEADTPEPRAGWVRLVVSAVGICGTDLHLWRGALNGAGVRPGHEVAGVVHAVGEGVSMELGRKVVVEPILACGACFSCGTGHRNRCAEVRIFGVSARGGMADYLTVPAACLHPLPDELDDNVAALSEPMAVCVRAVRLARMANGDRVAVLGAGTIGLLTALLARASGAGEVFVTARYPHQAALASSFGATRVFRSAADLLAAVGDRLIDVVIETVGGQADTMAEAVHLARPGGTIVMLGVFDDRVSMPGLELMLKELTVIGSNCYAHDARIGDFERATELVTAHRDLLPELVSHRFGLDQVADAFAAAADKTVGAVKVQVMPGAGGGAKGR